MVGLDDVCQINAVNYMTMMNSTLYMVGSADGERHTYNDNDISSTVYKIDVDGKSKRNLNCPAFI